MTDIELIFYPLAQPIDWSIYSIKPTACLLIVDSAISDSLLVSIVAGAARAGCTFFLIWGKMANELHDRIDEIIESGSDDWLRIVTTSQMGKTAEDVSALLFTGTLPGKPEVRYFVIGDRPLAEMQRAIAVPRA